MSELCQEGWQRRSLASLGEYLNGFAFNENYWSKHGLPIVRIAQITGSQGIVDRYQGQLPETCRLNDGDLIFSWSGTLAVVKWFGGPAWLNQHLFKVVARSDIDRSFLFHILQSSVAEMDKRTHGSTMKHIKRGELKEFLVDIPIVKNEQKLIADVLDTLDTAIHETEAIIAKLKDVKQGLLHDLLTRGVDANGELRPPQSEAPQLYKQSPLGWIPKEWELKPLDELSEVSRGKFTHRPRNDPAFYGGRYPFIQTGDVAAAQGGFVSTYSQTLSERGISVSQEFPAGTIAITIAANIADTAILACPMFFPDSVVGATVFPEHNIRFVELSIRRAKRTLDARAPQSAQKNINLQDLRPLLLATPAKVEQDEIAKRYDTIQAQLEAEQMVSIKLRHHKAGLMDDLLTGHVRVTPLLKGATS